MYQAKVNSTDNDGRTSLRKNGHTDIVKMLISEFKTDINLSDNQHQTPLYYACEAGHTDVIRMLITEFDSYVNCIDIFG